MKTRNRRRRHDHPFDHPYTVPPTLPEPAQPALRAPPAITHPRRSRSREAGGAPRLTRQQHHPVIRQTRVGRVADIGLDHRRVDPRGPRTEPRRSSRECNHLQRDRLDPLTPEPVHSLRSVDSSGTRPASPISQKRRRCNESQTSRTSRPYPQPLRAFTTIIRTNVSIGIVGLPSVAADVPSFASCSRHNSHTDTYTRPSADHRQPPPARPLTPQTPPATTPPANTAADLASPSTPRHHKHTIRHMQGFLPQASDRTRYFRIN